MTDISLALSLLADTLAICRLQKESEIPPWALAEGFSSITRTADELSVICLQKNVPHGFRCEKGWRCLKVEGPLDFALTGILASLTTVLAQAQISIFAVSTFDTDYILVKEEQLKNAIEVLSKAGHSLLQ
jgi:hypothetical protein